MLRPANCSDAFSYADFMLVTSATTTKAEEVPAAQAQLTNGEEST
jgi:hypothetical protein